MLSAWHGVYWIWDYKAGAYNDGMIDHPLKGKAFLISLGGWDMTLGWIEMTYMIPLGKDTSIFLFFLQPQ